MSLRPCPQPGCPTLLGRGQTCPIHPRIPFAGSGAAGPLPRDWSRRRDAVLREEPLCRTCRLRPSTTVDHILPRAFGGGHERANLQALCDICAAAKDAADAVEGRRRSRRL